MELEENEDVPSISTLKQIIKLIKRPIHFLNLTKKYMRDGVHRAMFIKPSVSFGTVAHYY